MRMGEWSSAREALRRAIGPGDRIFFSIASGQPRTLLRALAEDFEYYRDVEVINGVLLAEHPLAAKGLEASFRCVSIQNSASVRREWEEGRIDFLPVRYSDVPRVFSRTGPAPLGAALIQVAPPDKNGRFSLGVSASHSYPLALEARTVVAEVNEQAPRTFGPCSLAPEQIDFLVECSTPLVPYPEIKFGETEKRIADFVAELIPDGATIQIGIGNLPAAILKVLEGKKDLGFHSGMLSDSVVDLVEKGAVTNSRKNVRRGKIVAGELIGTEKLFRFGHENPVLEMHGAGRQPQRPADRRDRRLHRHQLRPGGGPVRADQRRIPGRGPAQRSRRAVRFRRGGVFFTGRKIDHRFDLISREGKDLPDRPPPPCRCDRHGSAVHDRYRGYRIRSRGAPGKIRAAPRRSPHLHRPS